MDEHIMHTKKGVRIIVEWNCRSKMPMLSTGYIYPNDEVTTTRSLGFEKMSDNYIARNRAPGHNA